MLSTVTSKGQITIPVGIRSRFHIQPNDRIDFMVDDERIIITPVKPIKQLRGVILSSGTKDFDSERAEAKLTLAKRFSEELS